MYCRIVLYVSCNSGDGNLRDWEIPVREKGETSLCLGEVHPLMIRVWLGRTAEFIRRLATLRFQSVTMDPDPRALSFERRFEAKTSHESGV